jgi:hypothetical protein
VTSLPVPFSIFSTKLRSCSHSRRGTEVSQVGNTSSLLLLNLFSFRSIFTVLNTQMHRLPEGSTTLKPKPPSADEPEPDLCTPTLKTDSLISVMLPSHWPLHSMPLRHIYARVSHVIITSVLPLSARSLFHYASTQSILSITTKYTLFLRLCCY